MVFLPLEVGGRNLKCLTFSKDGRTSHLWCFYLNKFVYVLWLCRWIFQSYKGMDDRWWAIVSFASRSQIWENTRYVNSHFQTLNSSTNSLWFLFIFIMLVVSFMWKGARLYAVFLLLLRIHLIKSLKSNDNKLSMSIPKHLEYSGHYSSAMVLFHKDMQISIWLIKISSVSITIDFTVNKSIHWFLYWLSVNIKTDK